MVTIAISTVCALYVNCLDSKCFCLDKFALKMSEDQNVVDCGENVHVGMYSQTEGISQIGAGFCLRVCSFCHPWFKQKKIKWCERVVAVQLSCKISFQLIYRQMKCKLLKRVCEYKKQALYKHIRTKPAVPRGEYYWRTNWKLNHKL